jgi:site-specific recombinase XerC
VGPRLAEILHARFIVGRPPSSNHYQVAKALTAAAGSLPPQRLSAAHIIQYDDELRTTPYATATRACRAKVLRQILRWLWQYHGAPKLDDHVRKYPAPRPRNVTATDQERAALLAAAPPHLRLWLLFCSDLAIRSGTAQRLNHQNYDDATGTLTFITKCDEHLTLPVTAEIAAILHTCNHDDPKPYVHQLWANYRATNHLTGNLRTYSPAHLSRSFAQLRRSIGITRKLTLHDFRRTTAVAMLRATADVRDVQAVLGHKNLTSTIWYLDHDLRPIKRHTLELIKRPEWRKENIA